MCACRFQRSKSHLEEYCLPLHLLSQCPAFTPGTAVCLGMFDGVHLGHRALINATAHAAAKSNLIPCAFTFDIPPSAVLSPGKNVHLLTDIRLKSDLMHQAGLAHVIYAHFDHLIADLSAEAFFEEILLKQLNVRHIVIGFHYRFGKNAKGDAALLETLCKTHGVALTVVPPVTTSDGELISSTAIRQALENGNYPLAARMLGRPVQ